MSTPAKLVFTLASSNSPETIKRACQNWWSHYGHFSSSGGFKVTQCADGGYLVVTEVNAGSEGHAKMLNQNLAETFRRHNITMM